MPYTKKCFSLEQMHKKLQTTNPPISTTATILNFDFLLRLKSIFILFQLQYTVTQFELFSCDYRITATLSTCLKGELDFIICVIGMGVVGSVGTQMHPGYLLILCKLVSSKLHHEVSGLMVLVVN